MKVLSVERESPAARAGIRAGDELVAHGGEAVGDALDVAYALGSLETESGEFVFRRGGRDVRVTLPAERPEDLGLTLEPDTYRRCGNACIFCFVDQLPPGLRPSLYVKDEDFRLSFAFGNYVTLTNLTDADYERIGRQRLTPLYVSVHATEDTVRRAMLGNDAAPPILPALRRLGRMGVVVHAQIVVCPGVNDGGVLERTIADLAALPDVVRSVAVVPVGLTSHRAGLPDLRPVAPDDARAILATVERWQERLFLERGSRTVFASDELYLLAERDLPPHEAYEDFPQAENGVGLLRGFEHTFRERLPELRGRIRRPLELTVVTSRLAGPFLEAVVAPGLASVGPIGARILAVENELLGPRVTVAGLLSGRDLVRGLAAEPRSGLALVPAEAFNEDGLTIDGMTLEEIGEAAGRASVRAARDIIDALIDYLQAGGASS
jgi:putative radical SAM enzyme (TIGR03279 family)